MAHYALINKDNTVVNVITGVDEDIIQTDIDGTQVGGSGEAWENYYASLPWNAGLICKRTSYNTVHNQHIEGGTPLRGNFASVGGKYDPTFDLFIPIQPFPSWKFNYTKAAWEAPVIKPEDTEEYVWKWSEINKEWIKVTI